MEASEVVAISLAALQGERVVVVAGEANQAIARQNAQAQRDRLG
jgi:hypothetical protein